MDQSLSPETFVPLALVKGANPFYKSGTSFMFSCCLESIFHCHFHSSVYVQYNIYHTTTTKNCEVHTSACSIL